jgi:hypothetical protein
MLPIKNFIYGLLLSVLALPAAAGEIDEIDIRANFANFWSAMSKQDFKGATAFVHPLDLAGLRTQLLPVFVKAGEFPNDSVQAAVDLFFQDTPKERRAQLSGPEIYVLLFKMLERAEPDTVKVFETVRPEIMEIKLEPANAANVRFKMKILAQPETDEQKAEIEDIERKEETQLFGRLNGRWYLRMDESPSTTAAEFRKELGL